MSYVLASTTLTDFHKGSHFTLRMLVEDEDGDPYNLTGTTVVLRLAHSYTDDYAVLGVPGTIIAAADGLVEFEITPAMSSALSTKGYDFSIWVDDYPALHGRIGVLPELLEVE